MRKTRLIVAVPLVVGAIGLAAPAAIASPGTGGFNYGHCVSAGGVTPSDHVFGAFGINPNTPTGLTGSTNGSLQSDGNNGWLGGVTCPKF